MSLKILIAILIVNTLLAIFMFIWDLVRKKGNMKYVHLLIIFFCPAVGIVFFACGHLIVKLFSQENTLAYADIGYDTTRQDKKLKDDFMREVDILPLEEAFYVSQKKERRRALLTTLKKDSRRNISTVLLGLNNEDTETSHYAATVVLSTTSDYLNTLSKLRSAYENSGDEEKSGAAHEYLNCLIEFLESNIPDNVDKKKYSGIYLEILGWLYENDPESITADNYIFAINNIAQIDLREAASLWIGRAIQAYPDESMIYYAIAKMYYAFGETQRFLSLFKEIMESSMNISNETLDTIRFLLYKN